RQLIGDLHRPFASMHRCARRMNTIGEAGTQAKSTPIERLADVVKRNFPSQVAPAGFDVRFIGMVQAGDQNLPEPGEKLALAATTELPEVAISAEQRILHEVAGTEPPPQAGIELSRREDRQVVAIELQQLTELGAASFFSSRDEKLLRVVD